MNKNFTYSIKICKNKEGIRKFKICKYCNTGNSNDTKRCIKCFRKL